MTDIQTQPLEQKLTRLKEIQQMLEFKSVPLSQSMTLLEEALSLKKQIEKELKSMENKIFDLTKDIYLHYVLDWWFEGFYARSCRGRASLVRYADDCAPRRQERTNVCQSEYRHAVREMRVGPSGSGCRTRSQITSCGFGLRPRVVSDEEKVG